MRKRRAILGLMSVILKNLKKTCALVLVVIMVFSLMPTMAFAEEGLTQTTTSYQYGTDVTGLFDSSTGILTISGTGAMTNFEVNSSLSLEFASEIKSIVINSGVTSIGDYAFKDCTALTSVTIPDSVTNIGMLAFSGCSGLTSVAIPDSVTSIGVLAFSGCSGLTSVTISNSVTSINGTFLGCTGLTSIIIPNSVTSIDVAFLGCTGLTSIEIPSSVTSIGKETFMGCSGLSSITIPDSVTSIGDSAFSRCTGLTSIEIPSTVNSIGGSAFSGCSGLTSVTIPDSVTSIGYQSFSRCTGLTSVTIPDSVTSISANAFLKCTGLTSITIPDSVTSIGNSAFQGCTSLTSIIIPSSVTSIGHQSFSGCSELTSIINMYNGNQTIGFSAFDTTATGTKTVVAYAANTNFINAATATGYTTTSDSHLLSGITITAPTKTTYIEGEEFDATGMVVTATYFDGSTATVTGAAINGKSLSAETTSVTISYTEDGITKTAKQPITVVTKELASIAITTAPTKTAYVEGENFDPTGMIVTAVYADGSTAVITGVVTNGTNLTNGAISVTVSYTTNNITKVVTQPITVTVKSIGNTLLIDCIQGEDLFVPFRVSNANNLNDSIFILKYEAANMDVIDLVSQTKTLEITTGIAAGSGIEILSSIPGEIKFKVNRPIGSGKTWSGTVNIFKFKAKTTGKTSVTAEHN